VRFTTVAELVKEMIEAQSQLQLTRFRNGWMRYELVVLDELGYVVMPDAAAELLFQVIAGRAAQPACLRHSTPKPARRVDIIARESAVCAEIAQRIPFYLWWRAIMSTRWMIRRQYHVLAVTLRQSGFAPISIERSGMNPFQKARALRCLANCLVLTGGADHAVDEMAGLRDTFV
jgi:hypothetical protein